MGTNPYLAPCEGRDPLFEKLPNKGLRRTPSTRFYQYGEDAADLSRSPCYLQWKTQFTYEIEAAANYARPLSTNILSFVAKCASREGCAGLMTCILDLSHRPLRPHRPSLMREHENVWRNATYA
jgi:hypothetical protein